MRILWPGVGCAVALLLLVVWGACPWESAEPPELPVAPPATATELTGPRALVLDVMVEDAASTRAELSLAEEETTAEWAHENRGAIQVVDDFTGDRWPSARTIPPSTTPRSADRASSFPLAATCSA